MHRPRRRTTGSTALIGLTLGALGAGLLAAGPANAAPAGATRAASASGPGEAPGAPGAMSHFDLARKDCVGTARNSTSKVWFTVAGGVLSDVYYPTIDNTNVETLQYVVTDGTTFTDLQTRDTTYTVRALDRRACRAGSPAPPRTAATARHRLPHRPRAQQRGDARRRCCPARRRRTADGLRPVRRHDQRQRRRRRTRRRRTAAPTRPSSTPPPSTRCRSRSTPRPRPSRPTATTRSRSTPPCAPTGRSRAASSGFAGTASDGLAQLDADHALGHRRTRRPRNGNVVQTAQVDARARHGRSSSRSASAPPRSDAVATAGAQRRAPASTGVHRDYRSGWEAVRPRTSTGPRRPARPVAGAARASSRRTYLLVGERAQGQRGQDVPRRDRGRRWPARGGRRSRPATRR